MRRGAVATRCSDEDVRRGGVSGPMIVTSVKKTPRLLDVASLAEEYGPSKAFWREVVAKGLLPVIRPPQFRRVLVERAAVERLLASWTEDADRL